MTQTGSLEYAQECFGSYGAHEVFLLFYHGLAHFGKARQCYHFEFWTEIGVFRVSREIYGILPQFQVHHGGGLF